MFRSAWLKLDRTRTSRWRFAWHSLTPTITIGPPSQMLSRRLVRRAASLMPADCERPVKTRRAPSSTLVSRTCCAQKISAVWIMAKASARKIGATIASSMAVTPPVSRANAPAPQRRPRQSGKQEASSQLFPRSEGIAILDLAFQCSERLRVVTDGQRRLAAWRTDKALPLPAMLHHHNSIARCLDTQLRFPNDGTLRIKSNDIRDAETLARDDKDVVLLQGDIGDRRVAHDHGLRILGQAHDPGLVGPDTDRLHRRGTQVIASRYDRGAQSDEARRDGPVTTHQGHGRREPSQSIPNRYVGPQVDPRPVASLRRAKLVHLSRPLGKCG
ncbi:hypothetical protein CHELA40_10360 [Chelatococcus asaccharovorans]|nr:hypothetical protein CHELA40_10360 [Chelatococcus asaccharovorans]CAH1686770.1 hypothetical protein CHELA17_65247 [Chelatococcus asaccharovorans]